MSVTGDSETSPMADSETLPGTVFTPRQVRILKIAVIAMGILLVGGFAFVLAAIVYQASRPAQDAGVAGTPVVPGQPGMSIDLPVPSGAAGKAGRTALRFDAAGLERKLHLVPDCRGFIAVETCIG